MDKSFFLRCCGYLASYRGYNGIGILGFPYIEKRRNHVWIVRGMFVDKPFFVVKRKKGGVFRRNKGATAVRLFFVVDFGDLFL